MLTIEKEKNKRSKLFVYALFLLIFGLQLWLIQSLQLFGDEAFYWLEGQHLSLSYSELPGWTAWMIRLGTEIFGHNYFGVRIVSYLGFLSIFPAVWLLNIKLDKPNQANSLNLLLILVVPLIILVAIMALPDVWLMAFALWLTYFFSKAVTRNVKKDWLWLGMILAVSLNIHVRMWIWLFIAGLVFLVVYRKHAKILKPALTIALPITLVGFIPILIFNYHNDFVLFTFQFGRRHPWEFQIQNLKFLLSQILIISPLILFLWFYNVSRIFSPQKNKLIVKWIVYTALIHWLLYVILGLFADSLRTNVHWVLMSYLPVLALSTYFVKNSKRLLWVILSGFFFTFAMLIYLTADKNTMSNAQARILDNSTGWHQLSIKVSKLKKHYGIDNIVADNFMTAAELAFELKQTANIKALKHEKNTKHGRQKQLEIMGMLLHNPSDYKQEALLVVEDSTLKLINKGKYYTQLCKDFRQFALLETINIINSKKKFHLFKINNANSLEAKCEKPPLFYIQHNEQKKNFSISGWVIFHETGIKSLTIESGANTFIIKNNSMANPGIQAVFPEILDPNLPNNAFEISLPKSSLANEQFKIIALGNDGREYFSQNYFIY